MMNQNDASNNQMKLASLTLSGVWCIGKTVAELVAAVRVDFAIPRGQEAE